MNGKKARAIRQFARLRTVGKPLVAYREVIKPKGQRVMGADGSTDTIVIDKKTVFLDVNSTKGYAKRLKKSYRFLNTEVF